jgi:hypothetical protein
MATTVVITKAMRDDFDACMRVIVEEYRRDFRDVVRAGPYQSADGLRTITPADWIAGWRKAMEANGSGGPTGREIQRRGL